MTLIIAVKHTKGVTLAADTLGSNYHEKAYYATSKLKRHNKQVAIAYTTSYRFGQIAAHHVKPGKPKPGQDEEHWVITQYIPKLRHALKEHGWLKRVNDREESGSLLLAVNNRYFTIQDDISVLEPRDRCYADGSGGQAARCVLNALAGVYNDPPLDEVFLAVSGVLTTVGRTWESVEVKAP